MTHFDNNPPYLNPCRPTNPFQKAVMVGSFVREGIDHQVFIDEKTQTSGSTHQILVCNENVCLTWVCRKLEFTAG